MTAFWNLLGRKEQIATGIHLGPRSVRMVELRRAKGETQVGALGYGELMGEIGPHDLLDRDIREEIAAVIARTAEACEIDTEEVVFSTCQGTPILKRVSPDAVDMEELDSQADWEVEQSLLAPSEEYDIDLFPVERGSLVTAVRRELTDACVDICEQAGVHLSALDVDPLALFNAGEGCSLFVPDEFCVLVAVEEGFVSFAAAYGISFVLAESVVLNESRILTAPEIGISVARRVKSIVRRWRRTHTAFVEDPEAGQTPARLVVLNGAGAEDPELVRSVESRTGGSVEVGDPFRYQDLGGLLPEDLKLAERKPIFTVAMGMAYRRLEELC